MRAEKIDEHRWQILDDDEEVVGVVNMTVPIETEAEMLKEWARLQASRAPNPVK